jgi:hypothetical protein
MIGQVCAHGQPESPFDSGRPDQVLVNAPEHTHHLESDLCIEGLARWRSLARLQTVT